MIACVGESLIDRIGDKCLIGGCPLNVAVAASRLGAPVTFFGRISSDEFGRSILERMIDDGVLFDPQNCNAAQPTLCSKAVIGQDGKASYTFDYEQTAACSMTEAELSASFANEGDINLVFFGSISLLMEPMCNAIVPAMRTIATNPAWLLAFYQTALLVRLDRLCPHRASAILCHLDCGTRLCLPHHLSFRQKDGAMGLLHQLRQPPTHRGVACRLPAVLFLPRCPHRH